MYAGAPVLATNSGGPLETVLDNETGFLRGSSPEAFGEVMLHLIKNPELSISMGRTAHDHVKSKFGMRTFRNSVQISIRQARDRRARRQLPWGTLFAALVAVLLSASALNVLSRSQRGGFQ